MSGVAGKPRRIICIYHGNCADGFTAAWVVWKYARMYPDMPVEFVPGVYGQQPPEVGGADVIMVDFSYKRSVLLNMAAQARSILILDHHMTAAVDLAGFPEPADVDGDQCWGAHMSAVAAGLAGRNRGMPSVLFDMDRSGAQIAWDFFFSGLPRPALVDYVADRDLWRFKMPDSRAVAAAMFSFEYDFAVWNGLNDALGGLHTFAGLVTAGEAIERKHHKDIAELVKVTRREMVIAGFRVPVANLPYTMASDAAHLMAEDAPFAACYFDRADGQRVFSLRSHEAGADVGAIAAHYGGGGHKHAAGFQRPPGWCGDDCWPEASGLTQRLARALGGLIGFRNWELAEGGVTPPPLRDVWKEAEAAMEEWGKFNA